MYNYVASGRTKFYIVFPFGLVAFALTFFFLPDTTGLDLREQERYWRCVVAGKASDYHGIAIHPRHLSWYEHHVLKRSRYYDPELDRAAKVDELRILYESYLISQAEEESGSGSSSDPEHSHVTSAVASYFAAEPVDERTARQRDKERALHSRAESTLHPSRLQQSGF